MFKKIKDYVKRKRNAFLFALSLLISSKAVSTFDLDYFTKNDSPKIERLTDLDSLNLNDGSEISVVELRGGENYDIWLWIAILKQLLLETQGFTTPLPNNNNYYPIQTDNTNKNLSPRIAHKKSIDPGRQDYPSKGKILSVDLDYEYKKIKDLGIDCSLERFEELSTNLQTGKIDTKSVIEANGGLRAESKGLVEGLHRPKNSKIDLDFEVSGPFPYLFLDIKTPIDFKSLNGDVSHFPSYAEVAESIGKKLILQKSRFCDVEGGPASSENVLHIVDLSKCPPDQVEIMKENIISGAGSSVGIEFLF